MDCCEDPMAMGRVVCPKPRRANVNSSSMVPLRFHIRNDAESKSGAELLGLILKYSNVLSFLTGGFSIIAPIFFFGSPPCRTQNPVVQDAHFGAEKLTFIHNSPSDSASPRSAHAREQLGKKQAVVRIEGFDCPNHRAVATA
ncbi:hypothetical protein DH2020_015905 [Rehmannia glutinosa]|uniref:Uncharacterized protein n=1 Tax=Rehmannia glutinosa TaxID=99300 RepID=A0ABR0WTZ3_REHGL